ncbi:MAG: hypothetical protein H6Q20_961 [Bacteroidetes bacterium]|nr:hypothetical protein [Bacteroidota bacterium]
MNKKYISILILIIVSISVSFGLNNTYERIYLQTDKYVYLAGETVNFKIITTNQKGEPQDLSKIAYIELISDYDPNIKTMINVRGCRGDGYLQLPSHLLSGIYYLVSYTRYMKNEGVEIYNRKQIAIINTQAKRSSKSFRISDRSSRQEISDKNLDYNKSNVILKTDSAFYKSRQKASVHISNLPEDICTLSVSIAGEDVIESGDKNLVGWSRMIKQSAQKSFDVRIIPEYEGHVVEGHLVGKTEDFRIAMPVISFVDNQIRIFAGRKDSVGHVSFVTNRISGLKELVSDVTGFAEETNIHVDIHSPFSENLILKSLPVLYIDSLHLNKLSDRSIGLQIQTRLGIDSLRYMTEAALFSIEPKWVYKLDEYTRFNSMKEVFVEFIKNARFSDFGGKHRLEVLSEEAVRYSLSNTLAILDGIPVFDHEKIYTYNPSNIQQIDVYSGKMVFGNNFYDGMVSFHTYKNNYPGLVFDKNMTLIDYPSIQAKRIEPTPSWLVNGLGDRKPDFRHTLLWLPEVDSKQGKDISLDFFTSDYIGRFIITVEGVTKSGEIIHVNSFFDVEK